METVLVECPNCRGTNGISSKFCSHCGGALPVLKTETSPEGRQVVVVKTSERRSLEPKNPIVRVGLTVILAVIAIILFIYLYFYVTMIKDGFDKNRRSQHMSVITLDSRTLSANKPPLR